jgi:molybdenum cofactor biosynthesis enzyme MoaA
MYCSCSLINIFALNFVGRIDTGRKCVTLCCEAIADTPAIALCGTGEETIGAFRQMRERVILECVSPDKERIYTKGCLKCTNYQMGEWKNDYLINYVNLSMYPAPCQCRCFYCNFNNDSNDIYTESAAQSYETMFEALDFAIKTGLIAPNAAWQISSGEIAIHPYRDRIFDLVKDCRAMFYTNCFRFDYQIAANLAENPLSAINLSIDSGTRETWRKIKGFDNFGKILEVLGKYRSCSRPGQITLKYIVLPDINDGQEDFEGIINLMKTLGTSHLALARNIETKYAKEDAGEEKLVAAAGRLVAMLYQNKLTFDMFTFSPLERQKVSMFATRKVAGLEQF